MEKIHGHYIMNYNAFFNTKVSWCILVHHATIFVHLGIRVATNSFVSANLCELFALFAFFFGTLRTTVPLQ